MFDTFLRRQEFVDICTEKQCKDTEEELFFFFAVHAVRAISYKMHEMSVVLGECVHIEISDIVHISCETPEETNMRLTGEKNI